MSTKTPDDPKPPYYAAIFTSNRTKVDDGYHQTSLQMEELVKQQDGYLGHESVRGNDGFGITISYWRDLESIHSWKKNYEHLLAQKDGKKKWYKSYRVRICRVERDYNFSNQADQST